MTSQGAPAIAERLVSRTVATPDLDLVAAASAPHSFAWVKDGAGLVGYGEAARIDLGAPEDRFTAAARAVKRLVEGADVVDEVGAPGTGPVAVGAFTFDPRRRGSALIVPRVVVGRSEAGSWRTETSIGDPSKLEPVISSASRGCSPTSSLVRGPSTSGDEWRRAVDAAVAEIEAGRMDKVVLARDVTMISDEPLRAPDLAFALALAYPECFAFSFDGLVGASPELLVRRVGEAVESMPLAGSARRGADAAEEAALGQELLASGKNRHDARPHCEDDRRCNAVGVQERPLRARSFPSSPCQRAAPRHTRSRQARRAAECARDRGSAASLRSRVRRPCGAGARLHQTPRGPRPQTLGWVDGRGDGEWAIALRCAELEGSCARLFAGAGIVAGSDPTSELEETEMKLEAMLAALRT